MVEAAPSEQVRRYVITAVVAGALFALELFVWDSTSASRWGGSWPSWLLVGLGAAGATAAVFTWRWPTTAGAVVWATALVAFVVPAWQPFGGVLVALYVLARISTAEVARLVLLLSLVPLGANAWNSAGWEQDVTPATLAPVVGIWVFVAVATWTAGRAGYRSAHQVRDLEESLRRAEEEVRAEERRLIARDLHDIVAHAVTAMVLRAAGAKAALTSDADPRVGDALSDIEESGAQSIRELHRLLHTMHGTAFALDEREDRPGLAQLDALLDRTRASGLTVDLTEEGDRRRLDLSLDLAAYRCVQEALSNAMRHGGPGTRVSVDLQWRSQSLTITVTSTGGGTRPTTKATPSGGFGLVGLSERVATVGGTLSAGPIDAGYRLTAEIPTVATPQEAL